MTIDDLKAAKKTLAAQREAYKKVMKATFALVTKALFADTPGLTSFAWTQYTPYFADGDECIFGANTSYPDLNGFNEDGDEDEDEDEADDTATKTVAVKPTDAMRKKVVAFLAAFDDEDYKDLFGDHCKVIVTPTGIRTEEYEHD